MKEGSPVPNPEKPDPEASFRDHAQVALELIRVLKPLCENVDELEGLIQHSVDNPAQARLMMKALATGRK